MISFKSLIPNSIQIDTNLNAFVVWVQQSGSAFDSAGADGDFPEAESSVEGGLQEQEVPSFGSASQEDQGYQKALNKTSGTIRAHSSNFFFLLYCVLDRPLQSLSK